MEPSGRWWNHSGCSLTQGWSGRALQGVVERHLHPVALALAATSSVKSSSVPSSGWMAVWPPSADADGPRAAGVVGPGFEGVVAALAVGVADRVDRREVQTSKPMAATAGTRCHDPLKPPKERGNSSYQAPTRARSRSTQSGWEPDGQIGADSGPARAAATSGSARASDRAAVRAGSARACQAPEPRRARPRRSQSIVGRRPACLTCGPSGVRSVQASTTAWARCRRGRPTPPTRRCRAGISVADGLGTGLAVDTRLRRMSPPEQHPRSQDRGRPGR